MKPQDIVKAVFEYNGLNPYGFYLKTKDRDIARVKQESAYLVKRIFPDVTDSEIAPLLQMKRPNVVYSRKAVSNNIATYKHYGKKIERMVKLLTALKNSEVDNKTVETSLPLGGVRVRKGIETYFITVFNDEGERRDLNISDECYNALINSYNTLNQ